MRRLPSYAFLTTVICALALVPSAAQEGKERKPDFAEPKKDWKWDEDKRFDFLMERLASLEASLDAVDRAIAKASGKKGSKLGEARRAEAGNSAMDRKGGGPMKWNEFYGTTAEKFFYHPVDPSTSYHTGTVLRQMGSDQDDKLLSGIPSSQSIPAHQRPPQFDYIYRANQNAKQRAESEASAIQGQLDALLERREKLETEQADLWCRLAFRAIQRLNIPRRPELRFRLVAASTDPADEQRAVVLEAAARFLASALLIIDKADEDQATALGNIKTIVTNARNEFDDVLLANSEVSADSSDKETALGQFTALAQLLDDTSNNLSESYEVAIDGSRAKDAARKDQFRGLLQRSLIEYAQIVMALDEALRGLKADWKVVANTKTKAPAMDVEWRSDTGVYRRRIVEESLRKSSAMASGESEQDSVVGEWRWFVDGRETGTFTLHPNGKVSGEGAAASFALVDDATRRYDIAWDNGFTDSVTLTTEGWVFTGRNERGFLIMAIKKANGGPAQITRESGRTAGRRATSSTNQADLSRRLDGTWQNPHTPEEWVVNDDGTAFGVSRSSRQALVLGHWSIDRMGIAAFVWSNGWKWRGRLNSQGVLAVLEMRPDGTHREDGMVLWQGGFDWKGERCKEVAATGKTIERIAGVWRNEIHRPSWTFDRDGGFVEKLEASVQGRWREFDDGSVIVELANGWKLRVWVAEDELASHAISPQGQLINDGGLWTRSQSRD